MENFDELLKKYADFIVRVGVNPQPGQTLIINCPLEGAPLARLCVRSAYEAGARDVQVNWSDDAVARARMELGSEEALTDLKPWQLRRYLDYAESEGGVCVLHLIADDPELYAGIDGNKISRVNAAPPRLYGGVAGVHHERPGAVVHCGPAQCAVGKEGLPGAGRGCRNGGFVEADL